MAKTIDAFYDENAQYRPIEQGTYPAHINSFEIKSLNTRAGNAKVINMRYAIADEVSKQTQKEWEMNGYEYKVNGRGKRIPRLDAHGNQNEFSGKAVNVKLSKVQFVTSETKHLTEDKQEKRTVMKVTGISEWSDGVDIPQDEIEEDTPF